MEKKKIILFFVSAVIVLILGALLFNNYIHKQREKEKIENYKTEITMALDSFNEKTDKSEKIELFRQLQNSHNIYLNEKNQYQEITDLYENSLNQMEQSFTNFYTEEIQNLVLDVSNVSDRTQLNDTITSLNDLLDEIKADGILTDTDISNFENQINSNVNNYRNHLDEMTNSYYEDKIMENEIEDVSGVNDKDSLNSKIEALNGISNEIDADEFIKDAKRDEFKKNIEEDINIFENRVAEIETAEKEEAERKAKEEAEKEKQKNQNNNTQKPSSTTSNSTKPSSTSNARWTQEVDGVVYTAPQNVSDLYYAGHGMQLNVTYVLKSKEMGSNEPDVIENVLVFWIDHTTGAHYDEWGNRLN